MHKRHLFFLTLGLITVSLFLAGCARFMGEGTAPAPTAVAQVEEELSVPQEVAAAYRAALNFMRDGAGECVPPSGVPWDKAQGAAPQGFDVYTFDSEGCKMTVSYAVPATESTQYHVTVHNSVTGCCWQANVDSEGSISSTGLEAGMLPELANAAAAYCKEQGYTYEVQDTTEGKQCGYCIFENGEGCNAWMYFQGMCGPE